MNKDRIDVNCQNCSKTFETRPYLVSIGKGKYCSKECYIKSKIGKRTKLITLTCLECGKEFIRNLFQIDSKYCSRKCVGKANGKRLKGSGHWNWKGGISPRVLNTVEYREWRKKVFRRDNYRCVLCGYDKGHILEADHIKSWKDYPELRLSVDNGRTLCKLCHRKTPNYGHH